MKRGKRSSKRKNPVENSLYAWGQQVKQQPSKEQIDRVVAVSEEAFWRGEFQGFLSRADFLLWQSAYIKKRWWALQILLLAVLWGILCLTRSQWYIRRCMGVLAPVFILLLVPELWKNRTCGSVEIEGASCFNLQQVYAARIMAFGLVDVCLLSFFCGAAVLGGYIPPQDMLIHFFVPMTVAACICFRTLCSRFCSAPYLAISFGLFWIAVWLLVVQDNALYERISFPAWGGLLGILLLYLGITFVRAWRRWRTDFW